MVKCPNCGTENLDENTYCNKCGTRLKAANASQPVSQNQTSVNVDESVKNIIIKRFDAIKNKSETAVAELMDEGYNKFDDWAPYQRQERPEALQNEFSAFKVMSNYTYELKDLKTSILGDSAIATFTVHYQANMRNQQFDVTSRVTTVMKKQDSTWKIIHEHLSRFPQERPADQRQHQRRRGGFGFPF